MIFNRKHSPSQNTPDILINHTSIDQVPFFKFLGITIDDKLKWSEHTKSVKIKIAQGLHALNSIQNKSNTKIRKMIYNSLIHSHLTYGTHIWGNTCTCKQYTNSLHFAQKRHFEKLTTHVQTVTQHLFLQSTKSSHSIKYTSTKPSFLCTTSTTLHYQIHLCSFSTVLSQHTPTLTFHTSSDHLAPT